MACSLIAVNIGTCERAQEGNFFKSVQISISNTTTQCTANHFWLMSYLPKKYKERVFNESTLIIWVI